MGARKRKLKMVLVRWLDAYASNAHEPGVPGFEQMSVGWLVEKTRKHVKIAQTMAADPEPGDDGPSETLTVPRGMVQGIEILAAVPVKKPVPESDKI